MLKYALDIYNNNFNNIVKYIIIIIIIETHFNYITVEEKEIAVYRPLILTPRRGMSTTILI